ncbi:MAG: glutamate formimidoyltransferase [Deltaproteobacteria bacterium RIFCSPLOWO2_02_FULL_47_10]|nr:MAG: glutamate formimidoyltransferase [Deltaproteobacteria bacterium RIFCSPLOWO2_02_FULL_47_10]
MKLVECVPNFSEGRDKAKIYLICNEIKKIDGIRLLDTDPGSATNRTVVTFAGEPAAVLEAVFQGIKKAAEVIDMRSHKGRHPRQGATDVCPFIPISGVTMEECTELARKLGRRVGEELKIPVYLYECAASLPSRKNLADVRAGEYEALAQKLGKKEWRPDFGPAEWNDRTAKTGATAIGARQFLIAYNVNLNTTSVKLTKEIAFTLRERGRLKRDAQGNKIVGKDGNSVYIPGLFKECKATGWFIPEYKRAQITINLTNFRVTPAHAVFDAACKEAEIHGLRVTGSEIVGMVPKEAMIETGLYYLKKQGATTGVPEEDIIQTAVISLGLNDVAPFDPIKKIIEYQFREKNMLTNMTVKDFANELSRSSPAPGGGSVAALACSLSAALTSMVAALTHGKKGYEKYGDEMEKAGVEAQKLKDAMIKAIDEDTEAFNKVMACLSMPKGTDAEKTARAAAIEETTKGATLVPFKVLEQTISALKIAKVVAEHGNQNSLSDAGVAALMARAAAHGAYYNVLINLKTLNDKRWASDIRKKADKLLKEADKLAEDIHGFVSGRL